MATQACALLLLPALLAMGCLLSMPSTLNLAWQLPTIQALAAAVFPIAMLQRRAVMMMSMAQADRLMLPMLTTTGQPLLLWLSQKPTLSRRTLLPASLDAPRRLCRLLIMLRSCTGQATARRKQGLQPLLRCRHGLLP